MNGFFDDEPLIRFRCGGCTQLLKVSAKNIGKKIRCPACFRETLVPEKSVEATSEEMLYGVGDQPADTREILKGQNYLSFSCRLCQTIITVLPEQSGTEVTCPDCGTLNRVPDPKQKQAPISSPAGKTVSGADVEVYGIQGGPSGGPDESKNSREEQFPVQCPLCGTLLYATESQIGQNLKCPDCEQDVPVLERHRPLKKEVFQPKFYEGGTDFKILEGGKLPPDTKLIPVVCSLCHTRMYARLDQAGQEKECPDCGRMNRIVAPPVEELLTAAELFPSQGEYGVDEKPVSTRPPVRLNVDYRTIPGALNYRAPQPTDGEDFAVDPDDISKEHPKKRKRRKDQELSEVDTEIAYDENGREKGAIYWKRPELPARPLTARFWNIFVDPPLTGRLCIGITLWAMATSVLSSILTGGLLIGGGYGGIAEAIYGLACFVLGGVLLIAGGLYMTTISFAVFNATSNGGDEVDDWREFSLATGFYTLYYFIVAILPGFLLEFIWRFCVERTGHGNVPGEMPFYSGLTIFLSFPVIILIMLESSNQGVFQSGVIRSFFTVPMAWFRFYVLSIPLVIIPTYMINRLFLGDAWGRPKTVFFILAAGLPIFLLAYFRLLGRLAWIIEDTFRKKAKKTEEDEKSDETTDFEQEK